MKVAIIGNGAAGNQAAETIKLHSPGTGVIMIARETYPLYSPCALPDCLSGSLDRDRLFLKNEISYATMGIETAFGHVVESIDLDRHLIKTNQSFLPFDRLVLATGSRAVIPPLNGAELPGAFNLKTLDDLDGLLKHRAKKVVVVGSGNIGMEAAQAMQEKDCQVTLVEAQDHVMPRLFDAKPAALIKQMLERTGIRVLTGQQVRSIKGSSCIEGVETDQEKIACDMLIWAVGLKPENSLAAAAGIEIGETGGIKVDHHMKSSKEDVYACGDCAETYDIVSGHPVTSMLWPSARRQGEVAALNAIGINIEYEGAFNLVVGEADGRPFAALGLKEDSHLGPIWVIESQDEEDYWRILLDNQSLVGMQTVGDLKHCGIIAGLIRNRTNLSHIWEVIQNPLLRMTSPWLAEAAARYMLRS